MAISLPFLVTLVLTVMTSVCATSRQDALHSACKEACQAWEDWRAKCIETKCKKLQETGGDWFPCFLSCWDKSSQCVVECADNFWKYYMGCSADCIKHRDSFKSCRHKCVVQQFTEDSKTKLSPDVYNQ